MNASDNAAHLCGSDADPPPRAVQEKWENCGRAALRKAPREAPNEHWRGPKLHAFGMRTPAVLNVRELNFSERSPSSCLPQELCAYLFS